MEEVLAAIIDLPAGKAVGLDGITLELYKRLSNLLSQKLLSLFNEAQKGNSVPSSWSLTKIIVFPNKRQGSYTSIIVPSYLTYKLRLKNLLKNISNTFGQGNRQGSLSVAAWVRS